ncbi:nitroreductase family protein [Candidatus Omnitrophota bacterium]
MQTFEAISKRRSIRRFKQRKISYAVLKNLVDCARVAPSAANLQPLEYVVVNKKSTVDAIFPYLRWAGYLKEKGVPEEGRRPTAYIIVLVNKKKNAFPHYVQADMGAAIENILIAATSKGLGSCWIGAMDRTMIEKILRIPNGVSAEYTIALGYSDESSSVETMKRSHKYYKDRHARMHVPKRKLSQMLHYNRY